MDEATDNGALTGVLEPTEPWTIKAFSRTLRLAAVNAARLEGVTTGQWLERCVRDRLEMDGAGIEKAFSASGAAPAFTPPPLDLAGLAQLLGALGTMPEGGLRRETVRTTRAVLRQARGLAPVRGGARKPSGRPQAVIPPSA